MLRPCFACGTRLRCPCRRGRDLHDAVNVVGHDHMRRDDDSRKVRRDLAPAIVCNAAQPRQFDMRRVAFVGLPRGQDAPVRKGLAAHHTAQQTPLFRNANSYEVTRRRRVVAAAPTMGFAITFRSLRHKRIMPIVRQGRSMLRPGMNMNGQGRSSAPA